MQPGTSSFPSGSPLSDEVYNVIAALHEKLQGLTVMRQFAQNGSPQLWQQLMQYDMQAVQMLSSELERLVQAGQLRAQQQQPSGRR